MIEQYAIYEVFTLLLWIARIILYFSASSEAKKASLISLIIETLLFILTSLVWVHTKSNLKRHLIVMIFGLNVMNTVLQAINFDYLMTNRHEHINFEVELRAIKARYAVQCILLAPSIMTIVIYQANLILALASIVFIGFYRDVEVAIIEDLIIGCLVVMAVLIFIFTSLHQRELKRFRQQQELEKNREQFETLLQLHSDAIIIIRKDKNAENRNAEGPRRQ